MPGAAGGSMDVASVPALTAVLAEPARIGPNAVIQVLSALDDIVGGEHTRQIAARAGLLGYVDDPPETMIDEREVIRLHRSVRDTLDEAVSLAVFREAGLRTGDYILAHRIPGFVKGLLRPLPAAASAPLLMSAIARHAWTFVGSGTFSYRGRHPVRIRIGGCPICRGVHSARPACGYYAATFERLFQALVSPRARVVETACMASGGDACMFDLSWRHSTQGQYA